MILNQYAADQELRGTVLWVTFSDPGARDNFNRSDGEDHLARAVQAEVGLAVRVRARLADEPLPAEGGTAILGLAKPRIAEAGAPPAPPGAPHPGGPPDGPAPTPAGPAPGSGPVLSAGHSAAPAVPVGADPAADEPQDDDLVVDGGADQAEELVLELFAAELVSEEQTRPARSRPK
jgi:hypothetical protein